MKKTKKWLIIIFILIIFIGGVFLWLGGKDKFENIQKEIVSRGDIGKTISVTGTLVSQSLISLNFESAGRIEEIKVEVGDEVIEGQTIAILESNVLNEQVKKAKATLDKAISQAKMNDDSVREAEESVDNADDYLDAVQEYQDQLVSAAEVALDNATDYEDDAEDYYNQIVSDSGADSAEAKSASLTLTAASNAKKAAEEALETAKKNRALNIVSAENSLDVAEESLESIESDYARSSLDASVIAAQADYQIALRNLEESALKAPLNGVISKINFEKGEVFGTASLGGVFGEMITDDFVLEADIPESDVSDLKIGQIAEVTFDAFNYSDKFEAEIIEIEPASTEIQGVIYYKAKLKLENPNSFKLKEGMSADIDVKTDFKQNVIRIPDQFIFEENEKKIVYIKEVEKLVIKEIKEGILGDGGYTEIVDGLKEGDEIYIKED